MTVDVQVGIVIDRPRQMVADFAGDPSNATKWYANISSVDWETAPPIRIGSRMAFVAHFLGKKIAYTYEIKELIAGECLVMSTIQGPFPMETTYRWESLDAGRTRMTLRNRGNPIGFTMIFKPIMSIAIRLATKKDLRRLKAVMENPLTHTPKGPA